MHPSINKLATLGGAFAGAIAFATVKTLITNTAAMNVTLNYIGEKDLKDDFIQYVKAQ